MAESADATDSNSVARKGVRVQVPLRAPSEQIKIEYGVEVVRARIKSAILVTIFDSTFTRMDDEVLVQDWLWDDDTPEEGDDAPLSPSELALRKRMIKLFIGSAVAVIVCVVLLVVTVKVFTPSPSNKIPQGCLRGKVSECPASKKPTSITLPGGGSIPEPEIDSTNGKAKKLLERCRNGDLEACVASNSGG